MTSLATAGSTSRPGIVLWGVLGFSAVLVKAIWQLAPLAVEPIIEHSLTAMQAVLYVLWVVFMAYTEGYKGFQVQLAPRLVARGFYMARNPRPHWVALAPLFCLSLFHATRRRLIVSWGILIGVLGLIIIVRQLDQPWRGMIDGGVVVGLSWGLLAILWNLVKAWTDAPPLVPLDIPQENRYEP